MGCGFDVCWDHCGGEGGYVVWGERCCWKMV